MAAAAGYFSNLIRHGHGSVRESLKQAAKNGSLLTRDQVDAYFTANISEEALKEIFEEAVKPKIFIAEEAKNNRKYIALKCIAYARKEGPLRMSPEEATLEEIKTFAPIFWIQPRLLESVKSVKKFKEGQINPDLKAMSAIQFKDLLSSLAENSSSEIIKIGEAPLLRLFVESSRASFDDLKEMITSSSALHRILISKK